MSKRKPSTDLEARVEKLEAWAHEPYDFTSLIKRIEKLEAAIHDAPVLRAEEEWQPIATAPKDGTWILAYRPPPAIGTWTTFIAIRWFEDDDIKDFIWPDDSVSRDPFTVSADDDKWIGEGDFYEARSTFTHWRPLPAPPQDI